MAAAIEVAMVGGGSVVGSEMRIMISHHVCGTALLLKTTTLARAIAP
jgi:hypothetical protein